MTNDQKSACRQLALCTELSAERIASRVGCAKATAAKYIKAIRPPRKVKAK